MATIASRPMSAEAFAQLAETDKRRALVRGEVAETMPPGGLHGVIAGLIYGLLWNWAQSGDHGVVGLESGFILARDPDTVRGPDVFFVRREHLPATGVPDGFWPLAPDLAVEVVSPTETADAVRAKIRDYLDAGTRAVWEVYPRRREVVVHAPDGSARTLVANVTLTMPELLPGFEAAVNKFFPTTT